VSGEFWSDINQTGIVKLLNEDRYIQYSEDTARVEIILATMIKHLMGNYSIVTLFGKQWQNYHMKFACRDCDIPFYALIVFSNFSSSVVSSLLSAIVSCGP